MCYQPHLMSKQLRKNIKLLCDNKGGAERMWLDGKDDIHNTWMDILTARQHMFIKQMASTSSINSLPLGDVRSSIFQGFISWAFIVNLPQCLTDDWQVLCYHIASLSHDELKPKKPSQHCVNAMHSVGYHKNWSNMNTWYVYYTNGQGIHATISYVGAKIKKFQYFSHYNRTLHM